MKQISAVFLILVLAGCAAAQVRNDLVDRISVEKQAWEAADAEADRTCYRDIPADGWPKRSEAVAVSKCYTKIVEEKVLPVAVYPDLVVAYRTAALRTSGAYESGKISGAEFEAEAQENYAGYYQQCNARASAAVTAAANQDGATIERIRQSAAEQRANRPLHTTCYGYGSSLDCTTTR
jgi:hypothetical protein